MVGKWDKKNFFIVEESMKRIIMLVMMFVLSVGVGYAKEVAIPYSMADRERLVRVETKLEAMDRRIDDVGKKIDMLAYIFTALVVGVFGFALWDRKTTVKPVKDKTNNIIEVLRELAKTDKKVASVLTKFNLF
jgi:hypothetical protein